MAELRTPLRETQTVTSAGFKAADNSDRIVEASYTTESRLCKRILNKRTGVEWFRNLGERGGWDVLYKHCKLRPYEFELFMEDETALPPEEQLVDTETGQIFFQEQELLEKNIQQLREIGAKYGLTGRSKTELVSGILKAQRG